MCSLQTSHHGKEIRKEIMEILKIRTESKIIAETHTKTIDQRRIDHGDTTYRVYIKPIKNQEDQQIDVASQVVIQTNMLQQSRDELVQEMKENGTRRRSKCYVANILTGGKAIKLKKQIYVDLQLPNRIIQVVFSVVPKLSRPCIIGIDLLNEFRSHIDLDSKTISFPHLEGRPSIKIRNEETTLSPRGETRHINFIHDIGENIKIVKEEIKQKLEETNITDPEIERQLGDIMCRHRAVFRKEPGRLKTYQHVLRAKENQPFIGRRYPVPMAYRDKVDEEIKKMLNMGIIQRSSSPYINSIIPVIKKDGTIRLCLDARKLYEILV